MACLIKIYNEHQGHVTKSYIHELCKHLGVNSPYRYEFEKNRIDLMDNIYSPMKNKRKNKKDEVGYTWLS